MSVISQTIVVSGGPSSTQHFTASSDCVVSIRGTITKKEGTLSICSVNVLSGTDNGATYFEYKGIVLKKNDKITVSYGNAHISGFTIEG